MRLGLCIGMVSAIQERESVGAMMEWCDVWIQSLDHVEEPLSRRLGYAELERAVCD